MTNDSNQSSTIQERGNYHDVIPRSKSNVGTFPTRNDHSAIKVILHR